MKNANHLPPSATADRFIVRMPDGMRDSIKQRAQSNMRSMTAEILFLIKKGVEAVEGVGYVEH